MQPFNWQSVLIVLSCAFMVLNRTDTIQIAGIHPRNPITDAIIEDYLQVFIVTRDMDSDTIDPSGLLPWCPEREPIPMARLTNLNGHSV